jgi:hypothetical protein
MNLPGFNLRHKKAIRIAGWLFLLSHKQSALSYQQRAKINLKALFIT